MRRVAATAKGVVRQARALQNALDAALYRTGVGAQRGAVQRVVGNLRARLKLFQAEGRKGATAYHEVGMLFADARRDLAVAVREALRDARYRVAMAAQAVEDAAGDALKSRGLAAAAVAHLNDAVDIAVSRVTSALDEMASAAQAHAMVGNYDALLGDGKSRVGLVSEGRLLAVLADSIAYAMVSWPFGLVDYLDGKWYKIAIATLDNRTTETCRNVHGQVQLLEVPFELHGTPRYADFLMAPPFHWYCRTVIVVVPSFLRDDVLAEITASNAT